jgi:c-di-GMP-binding flagellar brake protein YcgR
LRFIIIAIAVAVIYGFIRLCIIYKEQINFFTKGIDSKFHISEIALLWKLAKECNLEDPSSLYYSVPALNRCISSIIQTSQREGTEKSFKIQEFLAKLYQFRTKVAIEEEKHKGLDNTRSLAKGQRLRIILKGKGVFLSEILNNGHEMVISMPRQNNLIKVKGEDWVGQAINVYLWRTGDASYVFDSIVFNAGMFTGQPCLYLQQTDKLFRAQKRNSVRCACNIYAQLYFITSQVIDYNVVENEPGYRCKLEDISEDGAMIRIGGKGKTNINIKLQFSINDTLIMMYGVIRAVEYNDTIKQSRLHFECVHIEPAMKNAILSYVYNVIPPEEKEINEAIAQTESDALDSGENAEVIAEANKTAAGASIHEDLEKTAQENEQPNIHIPTVDGDGNSDISDLIPLEDEVVDEK